MKQISCVSNPENCLFPKCAGCTWEVMPLREWGDNKSGIELHAASYWFVLKMKKGRKSIMYSLNRRKAKAFALELLAEIEKDSRVHDHPGN